MRLTHADVMGLAHATSKLQNAEHGRYRLRRAPAGRERPGTSEKGGGYWHALGEPQACGECAAA